MRCAQNLPMHELLGTTAKVVGPKGSTFVGLSGMVVDESKHTFVLDGKKQVRVPKKGCTFVFAYEGKKTRLEGKEIAFRPEERIKKARPHTQ